MNLLPLSNPHGGLSISEEALCLVEMNHGWRHRSFKQVTRIPLSSGLLKLSSAKPNILQLTEFKDQLRQIRQSKRTPLPVAVSLPDLCARTTIFEFSHFPKKVAEQRALLTWRFQQDLKLDTSQSRLAYGVYAPLPRADSQAPHNPDRVLVLAAAIRNEVVEQFEQACMDVDLLPISVGVAGLDIFDAYQATMQDILEAGQRRTLTSFPGGLFLYLSHWGFSFMAFKDGCPQFLRTKAITIRKDTQEIPSSSDDQVGQSPYPHYTIMKVTKEILATIQYYLESFPLEAPLPATLNLFMITDLDQSASLLPSGEQFNQTFQACNYQETRLQVTPLSPADLLNPKRSFTLSEHEAGAALPGYARLRVA